VSNKQTSGSISILNTEDLKRGEEGIVEVGFISNEFLGEIKIGTKFKFYEGPVEIGNGTVQKVIGWIEFF
jgi:hypothetical protein